MQEYGCILALRMSAASNVQASLILVALRRLPLTISSLCVYSRMALR